jgi:hypothetical protein
MNGRVGFQLHKIPMHWECQIECKLQSISSVPCLPGLRLKFFNNLQMKPMCASRLVRRGNNSTATLGKKHQLSMQTCWNSSTCKRNKNNINETCYSWETCLTFRQISFKKEFELMPPLQWHIRLEELVRQHGYIIAPVFVISASAQPSLKNLIPPADCNI